MLSYDEFVRAVEQLGREAEDSVEELVMVVHPLVWNGWWEIHERSHFLRWLGRKLKSRRIYALGLHVEWIHGLKEYADAD